MKLYYYKDPIGNFGDDLNGWLWPRLLPDYLDEDKRALFVGIGTLLNDRVPPAPQTAVFGAGVGYGTRLPAVDATWKFYCVRGPLSAAALGLAPDRAVTDAAALLGLMALPPVRKEYRIAYMSHHISAGFGAWRSVCEGLGIRYIEPYGDVQTIIDEIRRSEVVIAEAMHGAIVADALRVPWIAAKAYPHILDFKWLDWCQSLQMPFEPQALPSLWFNPPGAGVLRRARTWLKTKTVIHALRRLARRGRPQLSANRIIDDATARLAERLEQFKSDVRRGVFSQGEPGGVSPRSERRLSTAIDGH
jgi:succinoglycan biosynthesis protein ExoV